LSDLIRDDKADLVISAYTRTDHRHETVSFAGPYFWAGQSLLVHHDEERISGPDDLQGRRVCTVTASTGVTKIENMNLVIEKKGKGELIKIEQRANIDGCVNLLLDDGVDAVTTDDAILIGYQRSRPDELKIVGEGFSGDRGE
jgi:glutamate transport system substrate-binding protein